MSNLEVFSENEHQADEPSQHWKQERAASGSRRREGYVNRVEHEDDREKSEEQTQVSEERRVLQSESSGRLIDQHGKKLRVDRPRHQRSPLDSNRSQITKPKPIAHVIRAHASGPW